MPRRPSILIDNLKAGMIVPAHVHACAHCKRLFLASKDAKWCRPSCRMAAKKNG